MFATFWKKASRRGIQEPEKTPEEIPARLILVNCGGGEEPFKRTELAEWRGGGQLRFFSGKRVGGEISTFLKMGGRRQETIAC